jgi:hypothetical protein
MANSLLSPTVILKEAGRLFHQKGKFIQKCDRQYDSKFKQTGVNGKVGYSMALRDRNEYSVTTGATLVVQDTVEASQTLTVNTQKHIGMNFSSADLTMVIDEFSERYIEPAVAKLVANVEADALISMRKKVANMIDGDAATFAFTHTAQAKRRLDETLSDEERYLLLAPIHAQQYLTAVTALAQPIGVQGQYASGSVRDFNGFNIDTTTHLTPHQTGTAVATTLYVTDGAQSGTAASPLSTVVVKTGTTTFLIGDVITIASVNAVHPETKADLGYLKQFTITADSGANAVGLAIKPSIISSGAKQNVSAAVADAKAIVKVGVAAVASATTVESLAFAKGAFVFGSVDLEDMSKYGGWGATADMDGLALRIWRQGDIVNDNAPCRLDVYYGFLARYPQMACRIHADG